MDANKKGVDEEYDKHILETQKSKGECETNPKT